MIAQVVHYTALGSYSFFVIRVFYMCDNYFLTDSNQLPWGSVAFFLICIKAPLSQWSVWSEHRMTDVAILKNTIIYAIAQIQNGDTFTGRQIIQFLTTEYTKGAGFFWVKRDLKVISQMQCLDPAGILV